MVAVGVMFAGIGVIGALASILASLLVSSPAPAADEPVAEQVASDEHTSPTPAPERALVDELGHLRTELIATRQDLDRTRSELADLRVTLGAAGTNEGASGP